VTALPPAHLVGAGGAVGAVLRYLVASRLNRASRPYGTLAVNVVGSFVLGLVAFGGAGGDVALLVGTGACGSFTTFSSFSVGAVTLWQSGERARAAAYAAGTLAAAVAGVALARLLV
jgi:CrcB protein